MDKDIDKVYSVVADLNYPITLAELKNPTSECMVKFVLAFLSGFSIDANMIQKPTFEQLQNLSYPDSHHEIISLMNLHKVMLKITDRIFVKDLYLTDLTNPGAKKVRRHVWTLVNFILYTHNKIEDLEEPLNAIFTRISRQNEILEKKKQIMENRKEIVLENSKKTALKERNVKQITDPKKRIESKNKKIAILMDRELSAKEMKRDEQEKNNSAKRQVSKNEEKINEMKATLVTSPEEYGNRLDNFVQDHSAKKEEVQATIEKMNSKREQLSLLEQIQNFVSQEYQILLKVQDALEKSEAVDKAAKMLSTKLDEIQPVLQKLREEKANPIQNSHCNTEKVDVIHEECQKNLEPLLQLRVKMINKIRCLQTTLEESRIQCEERRSEKKELSVEIKNLEKGIAMFLKDSQNLYTEEIQKQVKIETQWNERLQISR